MCEINVRILSNLMTRNAMLLLIITITLMSGCATVTGKKTLNNVETQKALTIEEKWGIEVLGIRPTAAGQMMHFRYKVLDSEKAASLVSPGAKPYIIDQASGLSAKVPNLPKIGTLRQRSQVARKDIEYFVLFSNPGNIIKSGSKVTVVIGDLSINDLIVE